MLYAPIIDTIVPAFTNEGIQITFQDNRAVNLNNVDGMCLLVKKLDNSKVYENVLTVNSTESPAVFEFDSSKLIPGDYYKFQLAYYEIKENQEDDIGSYSSVAYGRYLGEEAGSLQIKAVHPKNTILDTAGSLNLHKGAYIGEFINELSDETVDVYKFSIEDNTSLKTIEQTEWLQCYQNQEMRFSVMSELPPSRTYTLKFAIRTVNGFEDEVKALLIAAADIPTTFDGEISAENVDDGSIKITINHKCRWQDSYELLRKNLLTEQWESLYKFDEMQSNSTITWTDYSVEQGVEYVYAIRNFITDSQSDYYGLYSEKTLSNRIKADFEDIYLSDADRQLIIRFNPKVSSLKNTILEQKVDMIGSKYPYFFRNGNVNYKEIPISGLISYHMDDMRTFMSDEELGFINDGNTAIAAAGERTGTTNLTSDNFTLERRFKLAVLDWLNNGKPKIFRSASEGNYVVRLMNVSLSPNDTLGRMLHTFSATGYECMEFNYNKMKENNLIKFPKIEVNSNIQEAYTSVVINPEVSSTITLSNGPYYNITYITPSPQLNTYILLNNIKYYNTTGYFATPIGQGYNEIKVEVEGNEYSTITYMTKIEMGNSTTEIQNFSTILENSIDGILNYVNEEVNLVSVNKIYSLVLERNIPEQVNEDTIYTAIVNKGQQNEITISLAGSDRLEYTNINISSLDLHNVKAIIYCNVNNNEASIRPVIVNGGRTHEAVSV